MISFITYIYLNKKIVRAKSNAENINNKDESNIAMLVAKQLVDKLNESFDVSYSPEGEVIYYMKLPLSKDLSIQSLDSQTPQKMTKYEPEPEAETAHEPELDNFKNTNIDHDFLNRVTSIIYSEILNSDNLIGVIASKICISSSQLNRRVKSMTGMTTSNFILKTKLNRAKRQLTVTQKPIGEIALECGFNDFAYFSRSFKKEFDMTPTTFQRIAQSVN